MTKRLQYVGDSIGTVKQAMDMNERFARLVHNDIDGDRDYWNEEDKRSFIEEKCKIQGIHIINDSIIIDDLKQFVKSCEKSDFLPASIRQYFVCLWENYQHGWANTHGFLSVIENAIEFLTQEFNDYRIYMDDDQLIEHEVGSNTYANFYIDTEKNEVVYVEQYYAENLDMTLIFRFDEVGSWDGSVKEVVNYYYGRPNEEDLNMYYK